MKTGNVILAIFLWIWIPPLFAIGIVFIMFEGYLILTIGVAVLLFVLGLIALLKGMEKKPQPPSSRQTILEQSTNDITQIEEIDREEYMLDRTNLIYGSSFVGAGIIVLILTIWIEPLINDMIFSQWVILTLRIVGVICIVAGSIGIISALIPKKQS